MKPTAGKKDWRDAVRPVVRKIEPVTRVMERVAGLAVHMRTPTLTGLAGLAAAGLNSVKDLTDVHHASGWNVNMLFSKSYIIDALQGAGAKLLHADKDTPKVTKLLLHGELLRIGADGSLTLPAYPSDEFFEWLCQTFDRVLPSVLTIGPGTGDELFTSTPGKLTQLRSQQGPKIAEATRVLLGKGRCILLDGVPGVGKSTMAQAIAREMGLGRTLIFEPGTVGSLKDSRLHAKHASSNEAPTSVSSSASLAVSIQLARPGVIIIDDIDKIYLPLNDLEALRRVAKLVILTANNGEYDDVIDGAMIRPGRIDEVFSIKPEHTARRAPFDQLSDEEWEKVRHWPIAFLNELEDRLSKRPDNINLEEMEKRLGRKVRSGDVVR